MLQKVFSITPYQKYYIMTPYTIQSCEADKGKKGVDYHPVNIYQSEKSGNQRQRKKRFCLAWKPQQSPKSTLLLWANTPPHINYFIFFIYQILSITLHRCHVHFQKKQNAAKFSFKNEYYSAVKKNSFESVLMRWMNLEPIIQSEVSQKEKHQYSILTHIYGIQEDGNDDPVCKTEKRHRCV